MSGGLSLEMKVNNQISHRAVSAEIEVSQLCSHNQAFMMAALTPCVMVLLLLQCVSDESFCS